MAKRLANLTDGIRHSDSVLVVGLGRFGSSLASTLVDLGHEVLGIDVDERVVADHKAELHEVVQADTTVPAALEQLGAKEFKVAVVGIGNDVEASILTTSVLVDLGIPNIWAKAITERHGEILRRVGAHQVVFPEADVGKQVAHLVTGHMQAYVEIDAGFALVETSVPRDVVGKSLADARLRERYNVTVVCVKPAGATFTYATPDTVLGADDLLLVAGEPARVERFADAL